MKVARLTGSRRNFASITLRALYSARSVRADRPLRPDRLLVDEEGLEDRVRVAQVEVVARDLEHAAAVEERSLIGRIGASCRPVRRSSMLSSRIWLSCVTALAAQ